MGTRQSVAYKASRKLDDEMRKDHQIEKSAVKMLLLGPGECGKSTILKQMRILHSSGFSQDEIDQQTGLVCMNVLCSITTICNALHVFRIPYSDLECEVDENFVFAYVQTNGDRSLSPAVSQAIARLWKDPGVQECFRRANEYQLSDSAQYFLDSVERIAIPDYRASQEDILRVRIKTTGIVEVDFKMKDMDFRVFDVGGQRTERKKWIHCFDDVTAILFIVAMSEYNQVLLEDEKTNRLVESMHLFDSICNSQLFIATNMILFLNKKDLFAEKIQRYPLSQVFPEYSGSRDFAEAAAYLQAKFIGLNSNLKREIYSHHTCATDTDQVQIVLDSTIDTILNKNIETVGLD